MEQVVKQCRDIFKSHSVTYYYSTLLFPKRIRHNVFILYAFVRLADEYVDNPESGVDPLASLHNFKHLFDLEWNRENSGHPVVARFVLLAKEFEFEKEWIDAFLHSMEMDLYKSRYHTFEELEEYIYGSAEVIGLMMSRVMGIGAEWNMEARSLGKAMQLINFLRDIKEDYERGRIYFPLEELSQFGLDETSWMDLTKPTRQRAFIEQQINRIHSIQTQAENGLKGMPYRTKKAVTLASEGYLHTLHKLEKEPLLPFTHTLSNTKKDIVQVFLKTILHT